MLGLTTVWPEILDGIAAHDRALAERALMMPLLYSSQGDLGEVMGQQIPGAFDFLIIDGVALKQTILARRPALELLGPGDLLAPPLNAVHQLDSRATSSYLGLETVTLVAINTRFSQAARRWPVIAEALHERLGQQTHQASMHAAMLHLSSTEARLIALFSDFAERFGKMSMTGILIDLPLTHEILGGLVASNRSTVSLCLKSLSRRGVITHGDHERWTISASIMNT